MANVHWSNMEVGWRKNRERHGHQAQHHWASPKQKTPKTSPYYQPKQSSIASRNRRQPTLLRLDSAGESVEEFPNPSRTCNSLNRATSRPNLPRHSFLGDIFTKVSQPLSINRPAPCLTKITDRGRQGAVDLDRLVDKFTSNCDMDYKRSTNQMANQEVPMHTTTRKRQGQHATGSNAMLTFNGGPYITCPSQDNTPRTFPAYYRFLNIVHFHPYSTATRFDRTNVPQFRQQSKHSWGGGILQFHHGRHDTQKDNGSFQFQGQQTQSFGAGLLGHGPKLYPQHHPGKQYCGNRARNNNRMMQSRQPMSHPNEHPNIANATKVTSHVATETKTDSAGKVNHQFETSQVNPAFFPEKLSSNPTKSKEINPQEKVGSEKVGREKVGSKSEVQSCEATCASASQNKPIPMKACSNISVDKMPPNQEGHFDVPGENSSGIVSKNKSVETKEIDWTANTCSPSDTCNKIEQKIKKCNNTKTIANEDGNREQKHEQNRIRSEVGIQEEVTKLATGTSSKQMHSSIAFLLGDYAAESAAGSYDSDFSDADEDDLNDEIDNETLELFESRDPYNPLHGWKCLTGKSSSADQSVSDQLPTSGIDNTDPTLTFNDSGVSVVEQALGDIVSSSDESEGGADSESSDDWSDSGCDEEEQRVWDSLSRCRDPYDPICGWRCDEPSLLHSMNKTKEQNVVSISQETSLDNNLQPGDETVVGAKLSSQRHPSVSFILGDDDDDDGDDDNKDNDDDSSDNDDRNDFQDSLDTSTEHEELWQSFVTPSDDPYDPINGWRCRTPSLLHKSSSSPSDLCKVVQVQDEEISVKSSFSGTRHDLLPHPPDLGTPSSDVPLRKSPSTGCLKKIQQRTNQADKDTITKKVQFCNKEPTIISPEVPMWEREYMEARRGHWEEFARDRCRFMRRIRQAELNIAPCFTPEHRVKVLQKLYSNL